MFPLKICRAAMHLREVYATRRCVAAWLASSWLHVTDYNNSCAVWGAGTVNFRNVHGVKWLLRLVSSHKLAWPSVKCPWRADVSRVQAVRSRSVVDMSVIMGHRTHRRTSKLNHWIKTSIFDCLRLRKRRNVDSKVIELVVRWPHRWLVTEAASIVHWWARQLH